MSVKPWITKSILKSIKVKNKISENFIRNRTNSCLRDTNAMEITIILLINKIKRNYLKKYFKKICENSKTMCKKINELINKKKRGQENILICGNGSLTNDQKLICQTFNNYFVTVAQNVLKDLSNGNNEFPDFLKNPIEHSFFLDEVVAGETLKKIQ